MKMKIPRNSCSSLCRRFFCVQLLNAQGYNGYILAPKLSEKVVSARAKLTVPYSKECFEDLKSAKTHGEKFLDIGGMHATHDDFFIAVEKNKRKQEYAELLKERKICKYFQKQE